MFFEEEDMNNVAAEGAVEATEETPAVEAEEASAEEGSEM